MKLEKNKIKKFIFKSSQLLETHPFVFLFIQANILNMIVEMLSRRSMLGGLIYLLKSPVFFEYNALIILLTMSIAQFAKKRSFALSLVSILWIALGIVNCVLLSFRVTPLEGIDFMLLGSVWSIITVYLNVWQILAISAAVVAVCAASVFVYRKSKQRKVRTAQALSFAISLGIVVALCGSVSAKAAEEVGGFNNIAEAYEDYGFAFCFSAGLIDMGIEEPEGYCEQRIADLMEQLNTEGDCTADLKPNIIFLQLESFFDPSYLTEVSLSETPIPNFVKLKKDYSSGFLTVPSVGSGTANTEFEVITGMSLDYFGICEYPYKTVLSENTCESMPYVLKKYGYESRAIHNHNGSFYNRNEVYQNLGFDSFTSLEYMDDVERTSFGWAKDKVLTREILDALEKTEERDFLYTISVQGHGGYPEEPTGELQRIVSFGIEDEAERAGFEYYVNQLAEMDQFIGELVEALSAQSEPVILVMFGDHLPSIDIKDIELANGSVFQTEYVIWDNMGLEECDEELFSYQLAAKVFECLDLEGGMILKLHQSMARDEEYRDNLEMLQYDMLYGERFVYGGQNPYEPTTLQMGTKEIAVFDCMRKHTGLYIFGEGFTEWSTVFVDGQKQKTEFINSSLLFVNIQEGQSAAVAQVGNDGSVLSSTEYVLIQ